MLGLSICWTSVRLQWCQTSRKTAFYWTSRSRRSAALFRESSGRSQSLDHRFAWKQKFELVCMVSVCDLDFCGNVCVRVIVCVIVCMCMCVNAISCSCVCEWVSLYEYCSVNYFFYYVNCSVAGSFHSWRLRDRNRLVSFPVSGRPGRSASGIGFFFLIFEYCYLRLNKP